MSVAGLNNILCSNTTFHVFFNVDYVNSYTYLKGATESIDGITGLVPYPSAGDQDKVLKGDGTWGIIANGLSAIAAEYDSTATYEENDYCIYNRQLYKAS